MRSQARVRNPFLLMLNPEQVVEAMQRSAVLDKLARRTCHPLDRPVPASAAEPSPPTRVTLGMRVG